jgi:methyl-accepting chemotaxis protein
MKFSKKKFTPPGFYIILYIPHRMRRYVMKFKNLSIKIKFTLVFSLIIAITVAAAIWQVKNLKQIGDNVASVYKIRLLSMNYLLQADRDAYQSSIAISQALNSISGNALSAKELDNYITAIDENYAQIGERFYKFKKLHIESGSEEIPEFAQFSGNYTPMGQYTETIKKMLMDGRVAEARTLYTSKYDDVFGKTRDAMDRLTQVTENIAQKEYNGIVSYNRTSIIISVSVVIVTIIILLITGIVSTISFTIPINSMLSFAEKIKERDVSARLVDDRKDEFGRLMNSMNLAIGSVDSTLKSILEVSDSVFLAVNQITEGNMDLSQRTSEQASSLEEIASTIEESTSAAARTSDSSKTAKDLSEKGKTISDDGTLTAKTATDSIKEINVSSKKIVEIISVINEIAFQTNLLALNAAVEAARAGNQGRGFAVVAGEVRNLAQRSGSAAKEIEELIKDSVKKVEKGTELVLKTGETLKNISESNRETTDLISEVALASEEQITGMKQINIAINELDNMTQQNASLVDEVSSLSEEVLNRAKEMTDAVNLFTISD